MAIFHSYVKDKPSNIQEDDNCQTYDALVD